jgi:alpha-ketoglutarate-dependent taurine dioxygenase/4-hydroxybenzoate polyprenyltransferase
VITAEPLRTTPLAPFGQVLQFAEGTAFADLDPAWLQVEVDRHRLLVLRGLLPIAAHALPALSRRLGPLQPWRFGAVHEIKVDADARNYLYTDHAVPLHWDGAFADEVPHWLVFVCAAAPPPDAGGETTFVDTRAVLADAAAETRARWGRVSFRYTTEKLAHYGGSFTARLVSAHPTLGAPVLRYAEPVDDLNPVQVDPIGVPEAEGRALQAELAALLADPRYQLAHRWETGDVVIADNHALLHGRRPFLHDAPRHLLRVNVLDPKRTLSRTLRDAWRVRRPEYFWAELPILLIPAMLTTPSPSALLGWAPLAGFATALLLFHTGDMVNCWYDRDVDLHRKTHLAEAVTGLGDRGLLVQIGVSAALAAALGLGLALALGRWWLAGAGVVGAALAAQYTAPPLRLKGRGLLQIAAYVGLLFVGPALLVTGLFHDLPDAGTMVVCTLFGVMQSGLLLVNNAEDLDEDEREGVYTASRALGAHGAMRAARGLATGAGVALVAALAWGGALQAAMALPLVGVLLWNDRWLARLGAASRGEEAAAREAIRKQGRYVPGHVERTAWVTACAALGVMVARGFG